MSLDFMIGEEAFLGKGLAPLALKAFMDFLRESKGVTNFIIDPAIRNQRAVNAYQNAGFKIVNTFIREKGYFKGIEHYLMRMMVRDENISSQK